MRLSGQLSNQVAEFERMGHDHHYRSLGQQPNGGQMNMAGWNPMQTEVVYVYTLSNHTFHCPPNSFHVTTIFKWL